MGSSKALILAAVAAAFGIALIGCAFHHRHRFSLLETCLRQAESSLIENCGSAYWPEFEACVGSPEPFPPLSGYEACSPLNAYGSICFDLADWPIDAPNIFARDLGAYGHAGRYSLAATTDDLPFGHDIWVHLVTQLGGEGAWSILSKGFVWVDGEVFELEYFDASGRPAEFLYQGPLSDIAAAGGYARAEETDLPVEFYVQML